MHYRRSSTEKQDGCIPVMRRPLRLPDGLSSNNPNLQNIPVRTERGREIRKHLFPEMKIMYWFLPIIHRLNCGLLLPSAEIRICVRHLRKKRYSYRHSSQSFWCGRKRCNQGNALQGKKCKLRNHLWTGCIWSGR